MDAQRAGWRATPHPLNRLDAQDGGSFNFFAHTAIGLMSRTRNQAPAHFSLPRFSAGDVDPGSCPPSANSDLWTPSRVYRSHLGGRASLSAARWSVTSRFRPCSPCRHPTQAISVVHTPHPPAIAISRRSPGRRVVTTAEHELLPHQPAGWLVGRRRRRPMVRFTVSCRTPHRYRPSDRPCSPAPPSWPCHPVEGGAGF
jgi:hypothetical protein